MLRCPVCTADLSARSTAYGRGLCCDGCQGTLLSLSQLRRRVSKPVADALWHWARESPTSARQRRCPGCARPFQAYDVEHGAHRASFELDACTSCAWFWFDATELENIPLAGSSRDDDDWLVRLVSVVLSLLSLLA